jgi:hypothetical protein
MEIMICGYCWGGGHNQLLGLGKAIGAITGGENSGNTIAGGEITGDTVAGGAIAADMVNGVVIA